MKTVKSITKAVNILELFSENYEGLTLGDITKSVGLNESTVNNIVSTLVVNGFLNQLTKRGKYYLGVRILDIAGDIKHDSGDGLPVSYLVELSRLLHEPVCLEVWHGGKLPFTRAIDYYGGKSNVNLNEWYAKRLHINCLGKIILASLSDEDLKKYFNHILEKLTPNMTMDIEQLKAQLSVIRREGVAYENEEDMISIRDIAAGIRNSDGETIGSVFIVVPTIRITITELEKIIPTVKACASKISRAFAAKGSGGVAGVCFSDRELPDTTIQGYDLKGKTPYTNTLDKRMKTVKSITKAVNILELFSENYEGLTLGDIAKSVGLNESTVSHIVSTLVVNGFLNQLTKRGKYYLGVRILDIAGDIKHDSGDGLIVSYLVELSRLLNEPVCFEVWYGSDVLFTRAVDYYNRLPNVYPSEWAIRPLCNTCLGKIILANLSDDDLKKYFRYIRLERLVPNMTMDFEQLKAQLSVIRREGVAYEYEESMVGINGIAAGIKNSGGETIGSVYIVGNSTRLTSTKFKEIAPVIKACALKISRVLGLSNCGVSERNVFQ